MINPKDEDVDELVGNIEFAKSNIEKKLVDTFGGLDVVEVCYQNKKKRYLVKCPMKNCPHKSRSLDSHLVRVHGYTLINARKTVSEIIKTFNHITLIVKHGSYLPDLCIKCNRYVSRIDLHLVNYHSIMRDSEEFEQKKEESLSARSSSLLSKSGTEVQKKQQEKQATPEKNKKTKFQSKQYALTAELKIKFGIEKDLGTITKVL